jgi:serine/threonine protein kinase/Tol biopolymer transport system component
MVGIGETIGAYRVLEEIGSGGMGTVYRAADVRLGREVALKFITDDGAAPEDVDRFRREARAASAINHPNICTVYDIGEYQKRPFLVLELLKGQTLTHRIQQGAIPPLESLAIVKQIADALDAAHRHGIVHRDIKPSNVFIPVEAPVKILDFGVAKRHADPAGTSRALATTEFETRVGVIVGTHGYMSPEQARAEHVDARTDLFSLGVVLYEMLTGVKPFRGTSPAVVLDAILNRAPQPPSGVNNAVPPPVDAIVARALEKDRTLRYQSAADLRADIERITRGSAPSPTPVARRRKLIRALGAATLLGIVAAGAVLWQFRTQVMPPKPGPEPTIRRLTANPWALPITSSAISPDGKYLAYGDDQGVHVILRQSGDVKLVANTIGMSVLYWLPNSTHFFALQPGSALWILSVLGDRQPSFEDFPSVSPDGRLRLDRKFSVDKGAYHVEYRVADAKTGADSRSLASFKYLPRISGTWVDPWHVVLLEPASKSDSPLDWAFVSVDVRDGRRHELAKAEVLDLMVTSTLPGGRVLYTRNSQDAELWELRVDKDSGQLRDAPRQVTHFGAQSISGVSATSDGKTIVLQREYSQADVYVGRLSADATQLSDPVRLTLDDRTDLPTAWMPDGRRVVFASNRSGSFHIYTQSVDDRTAQLLIGGDGDQSLPRVTPDNKWILYKLKLPRAKETHLMRSPIEGGPVQQLLASISFGYQCGLHALCVLDEEETGNTGQTGGSTNGHTPQTATITTYRLDPLTGRKERLVSRGVGRAIPATDVSPDGNQLAHVVRAPECHVCADFLDAAIRVVSLSGEIQREILVKGGAIVGVDWAPNGRGFFVGVFDETNQHPARVYFIDLSGTRHLLWQTRATDAIWAVPSPDGRYLAIRGSTGESNLWSIEEGER